MNTGTNTGREVVVAGSHGLIGAALVADLVARGDRVRRLVRRGTAQGGTAQTSTTQGGTDPASSGRVRDLTWDPRTGELDPAALEGADAVVNLAGAGIGDHRWTAAYKQTLLGSRTTTTSLLARTVARLDARPVLVNASAVGAYGDRGDEVLTETSGRGDDFLAGLVRAWEDATAPAAEAGARVVWLRTGLVLAPSGGALGRLLPLLRLGLGGPLGTGRQWWSWITLPDQVAAVRHVIGADVRGPVNAVAPEPTTNRDLTRALAHALRRPAVLAVPRVALRVAVGQLADDLVASQRVLPGVLDRTGFAWAHATPQDAADWVAAGTGADVSAPR
ncbi:TIGR01777 family oxidoreductase [Promicromonospora citrea]|uniref:Epimerase n=1 Tax=Promicromonospora citrea TaxID=43677 RepID=A0A8H9GLG1_9MICO|nr:TIGR01777 family oxidoreductase [Promicromonospora citrea]NNH53272.1 TIGR01777 family protein [Promicromonospora citrea]GGM37123.1 epimerase [Promicromonospora citrea]